jgi:hypothetical protein
MICLALMLPTLSIAQVRECLEVFSECKEDCALEFASIRVENQKRLNKCLKRCAKKQTACEERELDARANHLDPHGSDKNVASGAVDEQGFPIRSEPKKMKGGGDETKRPSVSDGFRDDGAVSPRVEAPQTKPTPKSSDDRETRTPKEALRDNEVPSSSRTELKTDEPAVRTASPKSPEGVSNTPKPEPAGAPTKRETAEAKTAPIAQASPKPEPPPAKTPQADVAAPTKVEPPKGFEDKRALRTEQAPPPAPSREPPPKKEDEPKNEKKKNNEKKKDDLPPLPPKPKEEDHDDLRNY